MRWRSWWPLAGSVVAAAAGAGLTWESNSLNGTRSGLRVMFGPDAPVLPVLILAAALVLTVAGVRGREHAWAAIAGALTMLGVVGWYGIRIVGTEVRAIGRDSAGHLIEPEAASHLGIGWYLTATALTATVVLAKMGRTSRARDHDDVRPG